MLERVSAIELRSDNCAGADPAILDAVAVANTGSALAYGDDEVTGALRERVGEVFERRAHVFPVVSGTAANALALSALCPPWGAVLCHETAHVTVNEAAATSLFSGGAPLVGLPGQGSLLTPEALQQCFEGTGWDDPHRSQPAALSLTQLTDLGAAYTVAEIETLTELARTWGLRVHLDGARLANAVHALGCAPADVTWRAGVEAFTLGATKNGALSTDAIVTFDDAVAGELAFRLKRAGHVASKMRFASAQLLAYLDDDRWLTNAGLANAAMARLAAGLRELDWVADPEPDGNMAFLTVPDDVADRWEAAGLLFYRMPGQTVRFVTSFQTTDADVDQALERIRAAGA